MKDTFIYINKASIAGSGLHLKFSCIHNQTIGRSLIIFFLTHKRVCFNSFVALPLFTRTFEHIQLVYLRLGHAYKKKYGL